MSENYDIVFKNYRRLIDPDCIISLTNWAISNGCKYFRYWSDADGAELEIPLGDAVNKILQGGSIRFLIHDHDDFNNDFSIIYRRGQFRISSDSANFSTPKFTVFMLKLIKKIYDDLKPERVYSTLPEYLDGVKERAEREDYISWINIFSPEIVRKLGKDSLFSVKAYKVEELGDGGVLILLADNPMDATRQMCDEISRYIFRQK